MTNANVCACACFLHLCSYQYLNVYFVQIRVKHMLSQGAIEQNAFASTHNRLNSSNPGRIMETNMENLQRMVYEFLMQLLAYTVFLPSCFPFFLSQKFDVLALFYQVSYCENEVDCRRLLQLAHFGENFDPAHCKKTCDNCSKVKSSIEKDVTQVAIQLVWETT